MDTLSAPSAWRVIDGTVPVADVVKTAQCSRASIDAATRNGLIPVIGSGTRGKIRHVTLEDALLIIAVAALAAAAGLAFGALLRAMRAAGATVSPAGITLPAGTGL
jgi:hypothetical protein